MDFVSPSTPPGVGLNTVSWLLLDIGKKIMIFDNNNNKGQYSTRNSIVVSSLPQVEDAIPSLDLAEDSHLSDVALSV